LDDLRQRLIAAFRDEQREYVRGIRAILDKLRSAAHAVPAAELEEAFRMAHCLKAAARVCNFRTVETIGQRIEVVLATARKGQPTSPELLVAVETALAAIERWAQALADDPAAPEPANGLQALDRLLGMTPRSDSAKPAADELTPKLLAAFQVEHREHLEQIRTILAHVATGRVLGATQLEDAFRRAHSLKGAARIAGLRPAETLAHWLETLFAAVRDGKIGLDPEVARTMSRALDAIEDVAAALLAGQQPPEPAAVLQAMERLLAPEDRAATATLPRAESPDTPPPLPVAAAIETVRVSAENLDRLLRSAGQLLSEGQRQNLFTRELNGLAGQIDALAQAWHAARSGAATALARLGDAPELAALARALHQVEPRVHALARLARSLRRMQQQGAWDLQQHVGRLHEDARRVRMVSAESVLQGFRKMLRDLARDEGKQIDFYVAGFDLSADRVVLQALKDPLMHTLCNAVIHGIEPPAERSRHGKTEIGRVSLRLEIAGHRLLVTVEDDGRGIDPERVADAAVRSGLMSEAEVAALAPAEKVRLIFRPGLSTQTVVSDVSGRGMGLSVLHAAVARLQGEVALEDADAPGTRIVLSVPLSIATQRLLLVACRNQSYAIPVHAIERLLRIKPTEIERVEGRPMLLLHGRPVPVRGLAELLQLEGDEPAAGAPLPVVVLRVGNGRVAVLVDALLAERDSLVKSLDAPAARLKKLAGGILLEDGAIALVLNPSELLRAPTAPATAPRRRTVAAPAQKQAPTVLVVDDSLTTRTLEKSILEAHGYTVAIATDGVEALTRLRDMPVDLVITDIQMPRMDGFTLLEQMKKDPRLARLPVIVVTSQGKREDQERGLALGADAYIVKRKFDHEELLGTIRQIL
jgi:two-component system chemotaxis sensor kinase CheA